MRTAYVLDTSKFYNPNIQNLSVIIEGKHNQLYAQEIRSFKQYDEICKYFTEGKQRDPNANEVQKQLKLHILSIREYLNNKYTLWLDFRMIDENALHKTCRRIKNASEGMTLQMRTKLNRLEHLMLTYTSSWMLS